MSDLSKNCDFRDISYTDSDFTDADPSATREQEVPGGFSLEYQSDAHLLPQYGLPNSSGYFPSTSYTEDPSAPGGACSSFELNASFCDLHQNLAAFGNHTSDYSHSGDGPLLVPPVETHFKTSKRPKKYMLPVQDDPIKEKERQNAVKSFKNKYKQQQKEKELRSTLEARTEEVNRLRPQRDVLKQQIEEMERMLSNSTLSMPRELDTTLPEDYHSQLDPYHYPSDESLVPPLVMSASGTKYPCANAQNQPMPSLQPSINSRQVIRAENMGIYGDSSYNQHNPATHYPNALGVDPHFLGDAQNPLGGSQNSFLQPIHPASQETRTANPGTYRATSYDNQSEAMPAYMAYAGMPLHLSGTSASNQSNIASSAELYSEPVEFHPYMEHQTRYPGYQ